jgi:hypothetical protein
MKTKSVKGRDEAIQLARKRAEHNYGVVSGERQWLISTAPDSCGKPEYHVEVQALEGSPPKGYVLAVSRSSTHGTAIAYDCGLKEVGRFTWRNDCSEHSHSKIAA